MFIKYCPQLSVFAPYPYIVDTERPGRKPPGSGSLFIRSNIASPTRTATLSLPDQDSQLPIRPQSSATSYLKPIEHICLYSLVHPTTMSQSIPGSQTAKVQTKQQQHLDTLQTLINNIVHLPRSPCQNMQLILTDPPSSSKPAKPSAPPT